MARRRRSGEFRFRLLRLVDCVGTPLATAGSGMWESDRPAKLRYPDNARRRSPTLVVGHVQLPLDSHRALAQAAFRASAIEHTSSSAAAVAAEGISFAV